MHTSGGLCIAQDPKAAQFPAMPQAAIDTGMVDYVLTPAAHARDADGVRPERAARAAHDRQLAGGSASAELEAILQLLQERTNSDYRQYKQATVLRRIHRRMGIKKVQTLAGYLHLLQRDSVEVTQLSCDILIGVSSFFRDADAFEGSSRWSCRWSRARTPRRPFASGCRAAPPARRPTRWPCCCWRRG